MTDDRPNAEPRPPYAIGTCPICHEPGGFHDRLTHAEASAMRVIAVFLGFTERLR